jgi:hypothetical protein
MSDMASVKRISVSINKYRKWTENGFRIVTSKKENITAKFKKKFKAKVTVDYDFGSCKYKAKVRQSGDQKDHIQFKAGHLLQSLDIKLDEGNIANFVRFKLFLQETRNSENEILATALLRELGYLAPQTSLVTVLQNGTSVEMLMQEKPAKEFLEKNLRREGPVFEGDETLLWGWGKYSIGDLDTIYLGRLINDDWARRGKTSLSITMIAMDILQTAFIEFSDLKFADFRGTNISLGTPRLDDSSTNDEFWEFAATLLAMRATHALRPHNRHFYWNALTQKIEPIYYDGEVDIYRNEYKYMKPWDETIYRKNITPAIVSKITEKTGRIDREKYSERSNALTKSSRKNDDRGLRFLNQFEANLSRVNLEFAGVTSDGRDGIEERTKPHLLYDTYQKRLTSMLPQSKTIIVEGLDWDRLSTKVKVCSAVGCRNQVIDVDSLLTIMTSKASNQNEQAFFLASDIGNSETVVEDKIESLGLTIRHSEGASVAFDPVNQTLNLIQQNRNDWFLIADSVLKELEIKLVSTPRVDISMDTHQRFNEFGLTGCLTFHDTEFQNTTINAVGGACEDSVNIVNSSGNLTRITVRDAFADALDIDFSKLEIQMLEVIGAANDCVDVSAGTYSVASARLSKCGDKAVSVGESSQFSANNVEVHDANIAVSSKDSSTATIRSLTATNVVTCLEAYRKKQEFFGATLRVDASTCKSGRVVRDENSAIIISGARQ